MGGAAWPRFLPDLTYWYSWHFSHDTLPGPWRNKDICRELGVTEWRIIRPWRIELQGIAVERHQGAEEKTVTWKTGSGTLRARWVLGPDGDWWQAEYPVQSRADLDAAREIVTARKYIAEPSRITAAEDAADTLITALELPRSPLAEIFHTFLGWSEGLMLFLEEPESVRGLAEILDGKERRLLTEIARMRGGCAILPDNLDGRFITPDTFADSLAPLYSSAAARLHAERKALVVHVGGPSRTLLRGLAGCGVDCVEGVCGAPQGDSTLADARAECGRGMTLWGGIAQDFLLEASTQDEFQAAARATFAEAAADPQAVVGVADRVPVDAVPERLAELARMTGEAGPRDP